MIEVNRRLYLDEESGAAVLGDCGTQLSSVLKALIAEYRCDTASR
jgi:hypothetical protein